MFHLLSLAKRSDESKAVYQVTESLRNRYFNVDGCYRFRPVEPAIRERVTEVPPHPTAMIIVITAGVVKGSRGAAWSSREHQGEDGHTLHATGFAMAAMHLHDRRHN
jgi:hypothetical protein